MAKHDRHGGTDGERVRIEVILTALLRTALRYGLEWLLRDVLEQWGLWPHC